MINNFSKKQFFKADETLPNHSNNRVFFSSKNAVKATTAFEDRARLLAAWVIAQEFVKMPGIQKGNYKLRFVPDEGRAATHLHPALAPGDEIGIKVLTGSVNDRDIVVAFVRAKHKETRSASRTVELGGHPMVEAELKYADLVQLVSYIKVQLKEAKDNAAKEKLAELDGILSKEMFGRLALFELDCGRDPEKIKKANRILDSIKITITRLNAERQENKKAFGAPSDIPVDSVAGAAKNYPVLVQDENTPHHAYLIIKRFLQNETGRQFFAKWINDYVKGFSVGVEFLEHTTSDTIGQIQLGVMQAYKNLSKKEFGSPDEKLKKISTFEKNMEDLDKKCYALLGMVDAADDDTDSLKRALGLTQLEAFRKICSIASKRARLYDELKNIEYQAITLYHETPIQNNLQLLIAEIGANLCRIGEHEIALWRQLSANKQFKEAANSVRNGQDRNKREAREFARKIHKSIGTFVSAAEQENARISELSGNAADRTKHFKATMADLDRDLLDNINELAKYAPATSSILLETYKNARTHVRYKQGEFISSVDLMYYLPCVLQAHAQEKVLTAKVKEYLQANEKAFDALSPELRDQVLSHIDRLLYVRERGFDMFYTDLNWLLKKNFHHDELTVLYKANIETDQKGNPSTQLSLEFNKRLLTVPLSIVSKNGQYQPEHDERDMNKKIYGDKYELADIIPEVNGSNQLGKIYSELYKVCFNNWGKFRQISNAIENSDMSSPYFLATLTRSYTKAGLVSSTGGFNTPGMLRDVLSGPDTFEDNLRSLYPETDLNKIKQELDEFARWKVAVNILEELTRTLPYWIRAHVKNMSSG
ncbi:TPA: hypothetical protein HA243_03205 [Candidatus Micrarchaeota archaeon]|nr:hypothetical protein [Candidatus Micrarchaeota archaeon]